MLGRSERVEKGTLGRLRMVEIETLATGWVRERLQIKKKKD